MSKLCPGNGVKLFAQVSKLFQDCRKAVNGMLSKSLRAFGLRYGIHSNFGQPTQFQHSGNSNRITHEMCPACGFDLCQSSVIGPLTRDALEIRQRIRELALKVLRDEWLDGKLTNDEYLDQRGLQL